MVGKNNVTPPKTTGSHSGSGRGAFAMVGREGFEPSKAVPADLQSAPFGRSGTDPYGIAKDIGVASLPPHAFI
jgi:hypothetical protein